jgi:hypothetical protein
MHRQLIGPPPFLPPPGEKYPPTGWATMPFWLLGQAISVDLWATAKLLCGGFKSFF